jgi:hypothetical protein
MSFEKFIIVMQIVLYGFFDIGIRTRFRITFEARETIDCHFVPQRQASGPESRTVRHLLVPSVEQMGSFSSASKKENKIVESKQDLTVSPSKRRASIEQADLCIETRVKKVEKNRKPDDYGEDADTRGSIQGTSDADKATLLPTALRISSGDRRRRQGENALPIALGSEGERRIKAKMHLPTTPPGNEGHAIFDNMVVDWYCIQCR